MPFSLLLKYKGVEKMFLLTLKFCIFPPFIKEMLLSVFCEAAQQVQMMSLFLCIQSVVAFSYLVLWH